MTLVVRRNGVEWSECRAQKRLNIPANGTLTEKTNVMNQNKNKTMNFRFARTWTHHYMHAKQNSMCIINHTRLMCSLFSLCLFLATPSDSDFHRICHTFSTSLHVHSLAFSHSYRNNDAFFGVLEPNHCYRMFCIVTQTAHFEARSLINIVEYVWPCTVVTGRHSIKSKPRLHIPYVLCFCHCYWYGMCFCCAMPLVIWNWLWLRFTTATAAAAIVDIVIIIAFFPLLEIGHLFCQY